MYLVIKKWQTTGILNSMRTVSTLHLHVSSMTLLLWGTRVTPQKARLNGDHQVPPP